MGLMKLLRENEDVVECEHIPMTARYVRALHRLPRILRSGKAIARRQLSPISVEVVVWAPRAAGEKYDMYCVFSMDFAEGKLTRAILFAFYDGEEHSKVAIKGEKGARAEARRLGYKEISDE